MKVNHMHIVIEAAVKAAEDDKGRANKYAGMPSASNGKDSLEVYLVPLIHLDVVLVQIVHVTFVAPSEDVNLVFKHVCSVSPPPRWDIAFRMIGNSGADNVVLVEWVFQKVFHFKNIHFIEENVVAVTAPKCYNLGVVQRASRMEPFSHEIRLPMNFWLVPPFSLEVKRPQII